VQEDHLWLHLLHAKLTDDSFLPRDVLNHRNIPGNAIFGLIGSKVRQSTRAQANSISFCLCSMGSSVSPVFISNLRMHRLTFLRSWSGFVVMYRDILAFCPPGLCRSMAPLSPLPPFQVPLRLPLLLPLSPVPVRDRLPAKLLLSCDNKTTSSCCLVSVPFCW
jgi:hypothetical protein